MEIVPGLVETGGSRLRTPHRQAHGNLRRSHRDLPADRRRDELAGRVAHVRILQPRQEKNGAISREAIETTGEVFSDGTLLELIRC